MTKFLGILVTPDDIQNEGLEPVFRNIELAGAQAISFSPWLSRPTEPGKGGRLPDLHIDGYKRLLDRPLFGKKEVYLESFLSYPPDETLYADGYYPSPASAPPPELDQDIPYRMIETAHTMGVAVHVEVLPFLPPNVRSEDQPRTVDGALPKPPQVAYKACINSPAARNYGLAFIQDTLKNYPEVDGLVLDWAEYAAYLLTDHFSCFCEHCESKARANGFNWDQIKQDVTALWDVLHNFSPQQAVYARRIARSPALLADWMARYPGWLEFFRFKAFNVMDFYRAVRALLDASGHGSLSLTARGWPSPWNLTSGMDYAGLADYCSMLAPKIFTFDHTAAPRWYGKKLVEWNPELPESLVLDLVIDWLDLPDEIENRRFIDYHMPTPDGFHPLQDESYFYRINEVARQVKGKASCVPYIHAYRNESQWKDIISLVLDSEADGMWVQMYSYLSDRKFQILSQIWK